MSDLAIKIENVSKEYRLGAIGGTTLREEMSRFADKLFHRTPDNADIGKKFIALQNINLEVKKGALGHHRTQWGRQIHTAEAAGTRHCSDDWLNFLRLE